MKKLLAILLAMMLVMVSAFAFAAPDDLGTNGEETPDTTVVGNNQDKNDGENDPQDPETPSPQAGGGSSNITVNAKDPSVATGYDKDKAKDKGLATSTKTVTVNKNFTVSGYNSTGKTPAHKLTFTVDMTKATVTNATTVTTPPEGLSINDLELAEGATKGTITINLPTFTGVGVYTYPVTETDTNVAGITYATKLELKFTVIQGKDKDGNDALVIAGIALKQGSTKTDTIENLYDSGALKVGKTVTGNMGDRDAVWEFTITFKAPSGDKVLSTITIPEGTGKVTATKDKSAAAITKIEPGTGWETQTVYAYLKHGQSVEFDNLPAGVTYTVEETPDNNYTTTKTNDAGTIAKAALADAEFTNERDMVIDTGVTLETSAYVLIMALALAGFVMLKVRRREEY